MPRITCNHTRLCVLVTAALLCGASVAHARLSANRLAPDTLAAAQGAAVQLAANKLATNKLAPDTYAANPTGVAALLATDEGFEVLSFIVNCALPLDTTLVATNTHGEVLEFFGEFGLAPSWLHDALTLEEQGWVSACLFARVTTADVPNPISLRGRHPALAVLPEEVAVWSLEEGAFYGNYFVPGGEPIACRGEDQAAGETGSLATRDCAEPDPTDPSRTQCGFTYAGDCGDFAPVYACERFSPRGFYEACHDQLISPDEDARPFRQVITVFVVGQ